MTSPSRFNGIGGITADTSNDHVFVSDEVSRQIRAFGPLVTLPDTTVASASSLANTSAILNGTINPRGIALTDCRFEYVTELAFSTEGFSDLSSGGSEPCTPAFGSIPADENIHAVSASINGLTRNTSYRFRLVGANADGSNPTTDASFTTPGPPVVETTGSPVRTATTVRLDSRVNSSNAPATYYFEYGDQGPCDANPCAATEPQQMEPGNETKLVSQQIEGLDPATTYHYRVVADNGNPESPSFGEDQTFATFASDEPLSHGSLPGPPGSDRAWEQVNSPNTGGNPIVDARFISDEGDRAVYEVAGGTPLSESGNLQTPLFAERTPSGWQTQRIYPHRQQAPENLWLPPGGRDDLSAFVAPNFPSTAKEVGSFGLWKMDPAAPPTKVYGGNNSTWAGSFLTTSDDASRVVLTLTGSPDPEHPAPLPPAGYQPPLYDVSSGQPKLISLLPDGSVPACGTTGFPSTFLIKRSAHWLSADGSLAFFHSNCGGPKVLYVRDIEAEVTKAISGGPCDAHLIKSTPGAAFFFTRGALVAEDESPNECSDENAGDVYRYDTEDGALECVTCVNELLSTAVPYSGNGEAISEHIGVSEDGSRVYFRSRNRLLPGAVASGGTYRIEVSTGDLAYVGYLGEGNYFVGNNPWSTISPDGGVVVFRSDSPSLDALGGQRNGVTVQLYRYDDRDRSLVCVSCPSDGSLPRGEVHFPSGRNEGPGANTGPLSKDGEHVVFATPTPLAPADQNTAAPGKDPRSGIDVYEWRDSRLLLVSDGLTNWPIGGSPQAPQVAGITPDGDDVFFTAAAQYTPDALDAYRRLYDARIGGGFEFPPPPKPCPLEICQGTPKGAPADLPPGTLAFQGPAGTKTRCQKPKVRRKGRCVAKRQRRAKSNRQTASPNRRASR